MMTQNTIDNEMEFLKCGVWLAAREGRADRLANLLWKAGGENVNEILNNLEVENGQSTTPLIAASFYGHEEAVNVLLIFGVDIDQKVTIKAPDQELYYHDITALWCAAVMGRYNIVKVLVRNGANVNSRSRCGTDPLIIACYCNDLGMVQCLVEQGAYINYANQSQTTCLMVACENGYFDIVQYLLERGANTMATNKWSQTALHLAAKSGHLSVARLLVESGSTMTKDNDGLTPLMLAATNGKSESVEYLSVAFECCREDHINAIELLGASFMFKRNCDISEAYHHFQKAMQERFNNSNGSLPKRIVPTMSSTILEIEECTTLNELEETKGNKFALMVEALAAEERILGSDDWQFREHMFYTLELLLSQNEFDKYKDLLLYVSKLKQDNDEEMDVTYFTELFAKMLNYGIRMEFSLLLESFQIVLSEAIRDERTQNEDTNGQRQFETDIRACVYLIGLMQLTLSSKDEETQLHRAVYNFIQQNLHLQNGYTPLHMCCSSVTNDNNFDMGDVVNFPNARICKTLVVCGANVNARDLYSNTPLHIIARCRISDVDIHREIIKCLFENGAHFDTRNQNCMTAVDVASSRFAEGLIIPYMNISLKCLSASVITKHGIRYKDIIPESLYEFVELH